MRLCSWGDILHSTIHCKSRTLVLSKSYQRRARGYKVPLIFNILGNCVVVSCLRIPISRPSSNTIWGFEDGTTDIVHQLAAASPQVLHRPQRRLFFYRPLTKTVCSSKNKYKKENKAHLIRTNMLLWPPTIKLPCPGVWQFDTAKNFSRSSRQKTRFVGCTIIK